MLLPAKYKIGLKIIIIYLQRFCLFKLIHLHMSVDKLNQIHQHYKSQIFLKTMFSVHEVPFSKSFEYKCVFFQVMRLELQTRKCFEF